MSLVYQLRDAIIKLEKDAFEHNFKTLKESRAAVAAIVAKLDELEQASKAKAVEPKPEVKPEPKPEPAADPEVKMMVNTEVEPKMKKKGV